MQYVCPLCNGLSRVRADCPRCGGRLVDGGMVSDYEGPYAPYEWTPRFMQEEPCVHLLHCPECGGQSYAIIQNDVI